MTNRSDLAVSNGDLMDKVVKLERRVRAMENRNPLENASIGRGGLRLIGGDITVDESGEIHVTGGRIIAGNPNGVRAEMTNVGYRLINEDGQIDIDLTVEGETNQIRLRGSGTGENQDNEILLSNDGQINGRVVNAEEIFLGGENLSDILDVLADAATPTSGGADPDPPPAAGTLTRRYNADWSRSYKSNRQPNNFTGGHLNQGFYSGLNGNQRSMIGFPMDTIRAEHAGRTVTRVRIFLYFNHWYFNSGGTAVIGHHNRIGPPAPGLFDAANLDYTRSSNWPKPGGRWIRYDHGPQAWIDGGKRGIVLGPAPSTSRVYYGSANAHNQSRPPRIEIRSVA